MTEPDPVVILAPDPREVRVAELKQRLAELERAGKRQATPPTTTILEDITRDSLITIARDLDFEVSEQMISRDQIYIADEVFVCGSAAECIALREIDFRVIGSGKMGPVTRQIQQAYQAAIHGKTPKYEGWLALVPQRLKGILSDIKRRAAWLVVFVVPPSKFAY